MPSKRGRRCLGASGCIMGAHKISVRFARDLRNETGEALYGQYNNAAREIVLDADLDGAELVDTYIHELLEAVSAITDFEMPHYVIQTTATLLAQALMSHGTLAAIDILSRVGKGEEVSNDAVGAEVAGVLSGD